MTCWIALTVLYLLSYTWQTDAPETNDPFKTLIHKTVFPGERVELCPKNLSYTLVGPFQTPMDYEKQGFDQKSESTVIYRVSSVDVGCYKCVEKNGHGSDYVICLSVLETVEAVDKQRVILKCGNRNETDPVCWLSPLSREIVANGEVTKDYKARFQMTADGGLVILNADYSDMGIYTCVPGDCFREPQKIYLKVIKTVEAVDKQRVILKCGNRNETDPVCWLSPLSREIVANGEVTKDYKARFQMTADGGLVILNADYSDTGIYTCEPGDCFREPQKIYLKVITPHVTSLPPKDPIHQAKVTTWETNDHSPATNCLAGLFFSESAAACIPCSQICQQSAELCPRQCQESTHELTEPPSKKPLIVVAAIIFAAVSTIVIVVVTCKYCKRRRNRRSSHL